MKIGNILKSASFLGAGLAAALPAMAYNDVIVQTDAYSWRGDTIYQSEFKAWAPNPFELRSTYKGRPGYFMPVEQRWVKKNDLSSYPRLNSGNTLHDAIFNLGLDEMVNAVEPDTTLRTGKEWAGVWTRDVSYSIILSMAYMQPEASMISLMKKVNACGQIIQDTGSGGAWPISTDRMIWVVAAYEIYKVTGDRKWLEQVYPVAVQAIDKDSKTIMSGRGLVKGETSFIDWREQSYPKWMQTVDISQSEALGTNVLYAAALNATAEMAIDLGKKKEALKYTALAEVLAHNIDKTFWMPEKGYHGMYTYGRGENSMILNPCIETLGESLAILYDVAPADRQKSISQCNPQTPFGVAIFYPQISDMPSYHNNALWPFVGSYWALAQAKAGNEQGVLEGIGTVFRPAALFTTNKENFNLDNGDYYTELNSSNMLWSLSGNIALTTRILFGIHFEKDGLKFTPFVPKALDATRTLSNFSYRGATLNITVSGYGANVKSITLNGKTMTPGKTIPAKKLKGVCDIHIEMDNEPIPAMAVNHQPNAKTTITPITRLVNDPLLNGEGVPFANKLQWQPIEYCQNYTVLRNGKPIATVSTTSYPATEPGVYQVIATGQSGVPSFASEPLSNRETKVYQMPDEKTSATSSEISYQPTQSISGFSGKGFAELDKTSAPLEVTVDIPETGVYTISFIYANGNGPVNTENKAGIRTLTLDGNKAATMVFPHRGVANWDDWGMSNYVTLPMEKGRHVFSLIYLPEDENMNINTNHVLVDALVIEKE